MALGLIGRKIGMTQIFDESGVAIPVTLLELGPCLILDVFNKDNRGYDAVQLGFGDVKPEKLSKPQLGRFTAGELQPKKFLKEFRICKIDENFKRGDFLKVDIFNEGEIVDVHSISKGRGFQGVVKRYKFHGGRKTHGSHFHRIPGSIGACADPSKVFKGRKLPGRMGGVKVTTQNLKLIKVDLKNNLIVVRGSVPGPNGGIVEVTKAMKKAKIKKVVKAS